LPDSILLILLSAQGGPGGLAADAVLGGSLTCKDSLLVGWGGARDQDDDSCPVVAAVCQGSTVQLQRCTMQLHPESTHSMMAVILDAMDHASIQASSCKLIGPAPGSAPETAVIASAGTQATIALVSAAE
jgi:hypothetical protein